MIETQNPKNVLVQQREVEALKSSLFIAERKFKRIDKFTSKTVREKARLNGNTTIYCRSTKIPCADKHIKNPHKTSNGVRYRVCLLDGGCNQQTSNRNDSKTYVGKQP